MANITYIVNQDNPSNIPGFESISQSDLNLINEYQINNLFDANKHICELHITDLTGDILESVPNYKNYKLLGNAQSAGKTGASVLTIDPIEDTNTYGYTNGGVKLLYHFLNDLYTQDGTTTSFFISAISPDRTELQLQNLSITDEQLLEFTAGILQNQTSQPYLGEFRLNFGNNDLLIGINLNTLETPGGSTVVVKLYEPLPQKYDLKSTTSIVEVVADSVAFEVDTEIQETEEPKRYLRSANFNIDVVDDSIVPTQYLNYDELFSYPINNATSQLHSLVSEKGVELSIDHTDYANFVHLSSAYERLANFRYKLQLIESYNDDLTAIQSATAQSTGTTGSISYFENLILGVVNNFDHYERFLYYESGSNSWPKSNATQPYTNYGSTTTQAINWYANQVSIATSYDVSNGSILVNTIPTYLRDDANNDNYLTFIHMVGQHFDNLWIYAKAVTDKYDADNRLTKGISKDLVAEALKNFGVKLYTTNNSIEGLFASFIGQGYDSGSEEISTYVTASVADTNLPADKLSFDTYNKEVYKRLYHNLPLLLKSKGTERGLRALINCFGIPADILTIKTYGGRSIDEVPFYGDYQYYTSSLSKVRIDNTGSIVAGDTLSQHTSIVKREYKYTDDLHLLEVGFSPTNDVDKYIISKSLSTPALATFNIDDYLGDPRNLYLDEYYSLNSQGETTSDLQQLLSTIMSGADSYNVKDYVRLIKFFDNIIFKMVKDFIPARSTVDTGIIVKPHILQRNKAKSVEVEAEELLHTGSIDTAFISASNAGAFVTTNPQSIAGDLNASYKQQVQIPSGLAVVDNHSHQQATFDGELQNSSITVSLKDLNSLNFFKSPTFATNTFVVNRWLTNSGVCILAPITTNQQQGVVYQAGAFYLDSGSWTASNLFSGLSPNMSYEITSSNEGTSSFLFPFETNNYDNYSMHYFTASNDSVVSQECTSSFVIQVAICDLDQNSTNFRTSIKAGESYNISQWFTIGPENDLANVQITIVNDSSPTPAIYDGNISGATAVTFTGNLGDTFTITIKDTAIPISCIFNYAISLGICNVVPRTIENLKLVRWTLETNLGTENNLLFSPISIYNYGLARYFEGVDPDTLSYRIEISEFDATPLIIPEINPGDTQVTGTFYPYFAGPDLYKYTYSYVPQPGISANLTGNTALFKIEANTPYVGTGDPVIVAENLFIKITALESSPDCEPSYTVKPTLVEIIDDFENIGVCCFTGDTLVTLADSTTIRIDAIKVGDRVLSYNEKTNEEIISEVLAITSPTKNDIVKYTLSDGTVVEATTEHPFWEVNKGWSSYSPTATEKDHAIEVSKLEKGDILLTQEGLQVEIVDMELDGNRAYEKVYNFKLKEHYTYYANGILVHNKEELNYQEQCIYGTP